MGRTVREHAQDICADDTTTGAGNSQQSMHPTEVQLASLCMTCCEHIGAGHVPGIVLLPTPTGVQCGRIVARHAPAPAVARSCGQPRALTLPGHLLAVCRVLANPLTISFPGHSGVHPRQMHLVAPHRSALQYIDEASRSHGESAFMASTAESRFAPACDS